jgi:LPS-assembly protein
VLRFRLVPFLSAIHVPLQLSPLVRIIIGRLCHDLCSKFAIFLALIACFAPNALPQIDRAANLALPAPAAALPPSQLKPGSPPPDAPPLNFFDVEALTQEVDGPVRKMRGAVRLQTTEMVLYADEVDYNAETTDFEARGNVHFKHFVRNEEIWASRVEYNLDEETGKFYDVVGTTVTRIQTRPGVLSSSNPFHFEGKWAERLGERYVLHDGMITNCRLPRPWWTLRGPKFDIIPEDRALAYKAIFRLRMFPLFYTPYFYKSLQKVPRRSGFLTPSPGHSTTGGYTIGVGYFWAINRSYDVTYRLQDYTARGFAHHAEIRGKVRPGTDFDAVLFGVQDRGLKQTDGSYLKEGGLSVRMAGKSDLGNGFEARGELNYLSSLLFRQSFSQTFNEAIFTESHSIGFITRQWSTYSLDLVFSHIENFQSTQPGDSIVIRKLPELEFSSRDRQISDAVLPIWFSFDMSAGLLQRTQPLFQTRQFVERLDIQPHVTTEFSWAGFHLVPSFSARETRYGEQQDAGHPIGTDLNRGSRELYIDLIAPSFARVFKKRTFLGDQLKHVIEPRLSYKNVSGVTDFEKVIRFDETDLVANTNQIEISLTNRLYAKRNGEVSEVLSWQLSQQRYFDPTFGGAIVPGQRNVILSTADMTGYAFLDGRRTYSPVVSIMRASPIPGFGVEWRADYDPLRSRVVDSSFTGDVRHGEFFLSLGHTEVHNIPLLSPSANQFRGAIGLGNANHRGWNAVFTSVYDFSTGKMQFATTQVAYNTDCCGLSVQYRRFNFGTRFENQFQVSFSVANIASFGTLKKQERMF